VIDMYSIILRRRQPFHSPSEWLAAATWGRLRHRFGCPPPGSDAGDVIAACRVRTTPAACLMHNDEAQPFVSGIWLLTARLTYPHPILVFSIHRGVRIHAALVCITIGIVASYYLGVLVVSSSSTFPLVHVHSTT
jgi:hypothetical protein